jgi:hypothetical protein
MPKIPAKTPKPLSKKDRQATKLAQQEDKGPIPLAVLYDQLEDIRSTLQKLTFQLDAISWRLLSQGVRETCVTTKDDVPF